MDNNNRQKFETGCVCVLILSFIYLFSPRSYSNFSARCLCALRRTCLQAVIVKFAFDNKPTFSELPLNAVRINRLQDPECNVPPLCVWMCNFLLLAWWNVALLHAQIDQLEVHYKNMFFLARITRFSYTKPFIYIMLTSCNLTHQTNSQTLCHFWFHWHNRNTLQFRV